VVPTALPELIKKSPRAMQAMLQMKKIDIKQLKRAAGS
jgi:predicted 3-demethylubiquinone-9 3-methyltransferase (glyoxalase superfamily)